VAKYLGNGDAATQMVPLSIWAHIGEKLDALTNAITEMKEE